MMSLGSFKNQLLAGSRKDVYTRLLLIGGLLLLAAVLGFIPTNRMLYLVIALVGSAAAFAGFILYRIGKFQYALLLVIPLATLTNFTSLPTGRNSKLVFSLVMALFLMAIWISSLLLNRTQPRPSPVNKPIVWFVIMNIAAYIWSNVMRDPTLLNWDYYRIVRIGALVVNITLPLVTLLVINKFGREIWLKRIAYLAVGISGFAIWTSLLKIPIDPLYDNGIRGMFPAWTAGLAFALALYDQEKPLWFRGLLLMVTFGWFWRLMIRTPDWLSGWVPLMTALGVILFFRSKAAFSVAMIAILVIVAVDFQWFYQKVYVSNLLEGSSNRPLLWQLNLDLIVNHPLFGVGPAGYAPYYMTYHPELAMSTHNNYFDVLAQTGIAGSIVFIWMIATFLIVGNRSRIMVTGKRNFQEGFAVATLAGTLGMLLAMMLGDWVLPFAYNQTISGFDNAVFNWIFIGGMVSLYLLNKNRPAGASLEQGETA
jgi:hypothetical protein